MRVIETPQQMQELMKECIDVTRQYVVQCNQLFGLYLPNYRVVFSLKGTTAGRAFIRDNIIAYNPTLLRENPEEFLQQTVGHEVAHFASMTKYGTDIDAHGDEWKKMMVSLGLIPKRCHSYDVANVPTRVGKVRNRPRNETIKIDVGVMRTFGVGRVIEFD